MTMEQAVMPMDTTKYNHKPLILLLNISKVVGTSKREPSNTQKETSPLAHSVRNSLPHKSFRFCSPMQNKWKPSTAFPVDGFSTVFYRNGITIYGAKPKARPRIFVRYAHYTLATLAKFGPPSRAALMANPIPGSL